MDYDERMRILEQLVQMDPALDDAEPEVQYERCYAVYQALDKNPDDFALTKMIDAMTLEEKWFWRRKS